MNGVADIHQLPKCASFTLVCLDDLHGPVALISGLEVSTIILNSVSSTY